MLDAFRPKLKPGVRIRRRADGSTGLHHPPSGRSAELAADQGPLLELIDGECTLAGIAEAHFAAHHHVPFSGLRDLLQTLSARQLLANPPEELRAAGLEARLPRLQRLAAVRLATVPFADRGIASVVLALAALAAASLALRGPTAPLTAWDVWLAYLGASLALSLRSIFKASILGLLGAPPTHWHLFASFGVLHLAPDTSGYVTLDRPWRVVALLAALAGSACAIAIGWRHPGLVAGALAVLLVDTCPFAPTSFGKLLAAAAGKVDLREHARAYLAKNLFRRLGSKEFFEGEVSLIVSALLSIGWLSLTVRLLLTKGAALSLRLLVVGLQGDRPDALLASSALFTLIPVSLIALASALVRAVGTLVFPRKAKPGEHTGARLEAADLESLPVFSRLPVAQRSALAQAVTEVRYRPGEPIVIQGAPGDAFFAIRTGEVTVTVDARSGHSRELARLGPGDCFGETALLEHGPRTATVTAVRPTTVARLSREAFEAVRRSLGSDDLTAVLRATAGLHRSPLFARLAAERLSALAMQLRPVRVAAGAEVVHRGDEGQEFFVVESGRLEVLDGAGNRIGELGPGDHFGEIALLADRPRTATVRAKEEVLLLALSKERFRAALASDLTVSSAVEALAAERARAAR